MWKAWFKLILMSNTGKHLKQCHLKWVSLYFKINSSWHFDALWPVFIHSCGLDWTCVWYKLFIFRLNVSLLEDKSAVPHTWGLHNTPSEETCLVAFFSDGQQVQRAKAFIRALKVENVSKDHVMTLLFNLFVWNYSVAVIVIMG